MRISNCGLNNQRRERQQPVTAYGSRITNHANAHWPNEPTASQTQGHEWDTTGIASRGVGLVAGREIIVAHDMMSHSELTVTRRLEETT